MRNGISARDFLPARFRGQILDCGWAPRLMATYHPSAILRAPVREDFDRMRGEFVADLRGAVKQLAKP